MPTSTLLSPIADREPSGADIWNAIVQAAIVSFRARAFHEVTLEVVAAESGLSLDTVLERFPTTADLMVATVQVWNAERMAVAVPIAERHGAVPFLRLLVQANIEDPSLVRLLTAVVNIAATPDHPMAGALQRQWIQFHALVERALTRDVALERESAALDASRGAEQLIAVYEGLQLQAMVRPGMHLLDAFDHAVAVLRTGWSHSSPQVWEI
ncbi:MAG: TetR family transcriptional regulator [Acidobacteria bacterium]|nr:TetR family transcriptional regulator [Acidobacteriota bacterium]